MLKGKPGLPIDLRHSATSAIDAIMSLAAAILASTCLLSGGQLTYLETRQGTLEWLASVE